MKNTNSARWIIVAAVAGVAFVGAYAFAQGRGPATGASAGAISAAGGAYTAANGTAPGAADANAAGGAGCACCGGSAPTAGGITGDPVEGAATVVGGVQKIAVDVTSVYNPNVIKLKAGVPAEITFSEGQGCTGQVMSKDLGFFEDLTTGPKTVKIDAPVAGEYAFSCGMSMVFGKIVVE